MVHQLSALHFMSVSATLALTQVVDLVLAALCRFCLLVMVVPELGVLCVDVRVGSMILNCFLLCTLDRDSYVRFGIWSAFCILVYLLYSLHSIAYHHEAEGEKLPQFKCAPLSCFANAASYAPLRW